MSVPTTDQHNLTNTTATVFQQGSANQAGNRINQVRGSHSATDTLTTTSPSLSAYVPVNDSQVEADIPAHQSSASILQDSSNPKLTNRSSSSASSSSTGDQLPIITTQSTKVNADHAHQETLVISSTISPLDSLLAHSKAGNRDAQFLLAMMYFHGKHEEQNLSQAIFWCNKAAEKGDVRAQCKLGWIYQQGWGVKMDLTASKNWYRKAADQGDAEAQFNMGVLCQHYVGLNHEDKLAASKFGQGVIFFQAINWYTQAALQCHPRAQCALGLIYEEGIGVTEDLSVAASWYRNAADQGDAVAQCNLAKFYQYGWSVNKDYTKAINLYTKSADQNHKPAHEALSYIFSDGPIEIRDFNKATYWALKSGLVDPQTIEITSDYYDLIQFIPAILQKYSEFKDINSIKCSWISKEYVSNICELIRLNMPVVSLTMIDGEIDNNTVSMLAESLSNNTSLINFIFNDEEIEIDILKQIKKILTQNAEVAELTDYFVKHPSRLSDDLPLEVLSIVVEEIIMLHRGGVQSIEETKKSINEFLVCAARQTLGQAVNS